MVAHKRSHLAHGAHCDALVFSALVMFFGGGCEESPAPTLPTLQASVDRGAVVVPTPTPSPRADRGTVAAPDASLPADRGAVTAPDAAPPIDRGVVIAPDSSPPRSQRGRLRFLGPRRLTRELQRVLQLPADRLCQELGRFDCLSLVHSVSLGGVEPYQLNLYHPSETLSVSATSAVERVVLTACGERARLDRAALQGEGEAVLFAGLSLENEQLGDDAAAIEARATSTRRLYRRALLRDPSDEEVEALESLYETIKVSSETESPGLEWMWLSCAAVLSGAEFNLF